MRKHAVAIAFVVAGLGCGGSGSKSPAAKCNDLVDLVCDRGAECIAGAAGMHAECVQAIGQELACGDAKRIGSTYDRCVDQLTDQSCQVLFPVDPDTGEQDANLPSECSGVVLTARSALGPLARATATAPAVGEVSAIAELAADAGAALASHGE